MDISSILSSQVSSEIQAMKANVISSALEELEVVAAKVAETGDPAYILELSPMALALYNQSIEGK